MDIKKFFKAVNNDDFVPGIYNYCDRWCERCPVTYKCASYFITNKLFKEKLEDDGSSADTAAELERVLKFTQEVLQDAIKDLNINPDEMDIQDYLEGQSDDFEDDFLDYLDQPENEKSELIQLATDYVKMTDAWIENTDETVTELEKEFERIREMNIDTGDVINDFRKMMDSFDIIDWYRYLIISKLTVALHDKKHLHYEKGELITYNGYAKVALIGVEKSINAWQNMLEVLPDYEEITFKQLIHLKKIKEKIKETFPDAEKFKRPGFDD